VTRTPEDLPDTIAALRAALAAERAKRIDEAARAARIEAELAVAKAKASDDQAVIAHQRLQIAKLTRQLYGQRSERTERRLDQIELAFEELESSATEDEIAAERAVDQCGGLCSEAPSAATLPRASAARAGG
jgi:transposase